MDPDTPEAPAEYENNHIIERPDGFYWQRRDTGEEFGPFATLLDATKDMEYNAESGLEVADTPEEAEENLGIAGWIDEETGLPAEGPGPRIEDH